MTAMQVAGGKVRINGGTPLPARLEVVQEHIDVSTNLPQPDPRWSTSDKAGHFHACSTDYTYPTLNRRTEHRDCDGGDGTCGDECEGYDVSVWSCRLCDEQITPGTVHGPRFQSVPGMSWWTVRFDGPALAGEVSVRYDVGDTVYFGTAHAEVRSLTMRGGDIPFAAVELIGTCPLGRVGPVPVVQAPKDKVLEQFIADAQVALAKLRKAAA